VKKSTSCLISQNIEISPHKLSQLKEVIKEQFKQSVNTWNHSVHGLTLKNKSVNLSDTSGEISEDQGKIIVTLKCCSVFLKPTVGFCLGRVKEMQAAFIFVSILGKCDVIIEAKNVGKEVLEFKNKVTL